MVSWLCACQGSGQHSLNSLPAGAGFALVVGF
jgi:hypothetical protein